MDTSDEWIRQRTGIAERRFARRGQSSSALGVEAARRALADAGLEPSDLDLIVFATMTPDHYFPGNGGLARARARPRPHPRDRPPDAVRRIPVRACTSATRSSGRARPGASSSWAPSATPRSFPGPTRTGPCSSATPKGPCVPRRREWGTRAARPRRDLRRRGGRVRARGGGEPRNRRGFLGFLMRTDGGHWDKLYVPGGGSASFPYFSPDMCEDDRTVPIVEGRPVFRLATTAMPEIVREILARHGLELADLRLLLMHQANLRINEAVQKSLGLAGRSRLQQHPEVRQHDGGHAAARVPRGPGRRPHRAGGPRRLHRARSRPPLGRGAHEGLTP